MRCIVAVLLEADRLSDVRVRTRGVRWLTSAMGAAWATLRIVTWLSFAIFSGLFFMFCMQAGHEINV